MKSLSKKFGFLILTTLLATAFSFAGDQAKKKEKLTTLTGEVGDTLCGVRHSMPGSSVDCIRECIGKGSNYSLIIGEKVVNLETEDQALLATLEKLSGLQATVTGVQHDDKLDVSTVAAAK
jgi:hypothetical protein